MSAVLFVGFGWAARSLWLPALLRHGFDRIAVVDVTSPPHDVHVDTRYAEVGDVPRGSYDLAVIASPNAAHVANALSTLELGIPTVMEKPVCIDITDVALLRRATERGGAPLLRSASVLYDPHVRRFLEAVSEPVSIRAGWRRRSGVPRSPWLTAREHALAGSSLDLGWHLLEAVLAATGHQRVRVSRARFVGAEASGLGRASWHGQETGSDETITVDTAARISFTSPGVAIELETAWVTDVLADSVFFEAETPSGTVRLDTILGVSTDTLGPSMLREGSRSIYLEAKRPGEAHRALVADVVRSGFDPARMGQSWEQLDALAFAAGGICAAHQEWSRSHSGVGAV